MLDGLSATTHHSSLDLLREYGQITIQEGTRFVMHERVATSAGVTAGIDLALALVAREWGHSVAESVAANLEWESTSWKQAPSDEPLQQPTFSIRLATMNDSGGILSCLRAAFERYESSYTRGAYEDTAETELRKNQCKRITLDTTDPLRRAVRFYEKRGFIKSGRESDLFGMRLYEYVKPL